MKTKIMLLFILFAVTGTVFAKTNEIKTEKPSKPEHVKPFVPGKTERKEWEICPGAKLISIKMSSLPTEILMVKFEMKGSKFRFDVVQAENKLFTTQHLDIMAKHLEDKEKVYPVAGISGDAFNGSKISPAHGNPMGISLANGILYTSGTLPKSYVLYQTEDGKLNYKELQFVGTIETEDGQKIPFTHFNAPLPPLPKKGKAAGMGVYLFNHEWKGKLTDSGIILKLPVEKPKNLPAEWTAEVLEPFKAGSMMPGGNTAGVLIGRGKDAAKISELKGKIKIHLSVERPSKKPLNLTAPIINAVRVASVPLKKEKLREVDDKKMLNRSMFGVGKDLFIILTASGIPSVEAAKLLQQEGSISAGHFGTGIYAFSWIKGNNITYPLNVPPKTIANAIFISSREKLPYWKTPGVIKDHSSKKKTVQTKKK